jgi:alpha-tubulin suppressor-like RCC1 family protein
VTTGDRAYCWGDNRYGQLGIGSSGASLTPAAVLGGLPFRQIDAGISHTCGVTAGDDRAYCWGFGKQGALGDGTGDNHRRPAPVAGTRRFDHVNAGFFHTCGVTRAGVGLCWGPNGGAIGDGTTVQRLSPTRVAGGLVLHLISAGYTYTCGVTTGDQAYCWGSNYRGQVGDGTTSDQLTPVPVAGAM